MSTGQAQVSVVSGMLPRTVEVLGVVSLLIDVSSEMIFPLLSAFLAARLPAALLLLKTMEGLEDLYHTLSEGAEKSLLTSLVPAAARGRAFGLYNGLTGGAALASGLLFGAMWTACVALWMESVEAIWWRRHVSPRLHSVPTRDILVPCRRCVRGSSPKGESHASTRRRGTRDGARVDDGAGGTGRGSGGAA